MNRCAMIFSIFMPLLAYGRISTQHGGGHEVPTPFKHYPDGEHAPRFDRAPKLELAEGELYELHGTLVFLTPSQAQPANTSLTEPETQERTPFLKIDFNKHSLLANHHRRNFPYYPIQDLPRQWINCDQCKVRIIALTRSKVGLKASGKRTKTVVLQAIWIESTQD